MAHARLSASAAHRWMICPGSVNLAAAHPNVSSPEAAAGTYAHHIAAECLNSGAQPSAWLGNKTIVEGHVVACDGEMVEAIEAYINSVQLLRGLKVEQDLTPALRRLDPDLGGTADAIAAADRVLDVVDFKFGAGVFVSADDNPQLKLYAVGALLLAGTGFDKVRVTIVQPRIEGVEPVRTWEWPVLDVLDFVIDVQDAAALTRRPDAPLVPSSHGCKWCPARASCPALEKHTHELVAADFTSVVQYDPAQVARWLDMLPMLETRIKAIRELAYNEAKRGNPPPGYKLVEKRATRKWTPDALAQAEAFWPGEWFAPREPLSVAQLEKKLGKKEFAKAVAAEAIQCKSSGYTLVSESDARPAVGLISADDFDVITGAESND